MWIPSKILGLITGKSEEFSKLRTERDSFRDELSRANILNDWLRFQVNTLQIERTQLMNKAYGIAVPTPLLEKTPVLGQETEQKEFSFEDIGDELAKKFNLPVYGN